MKKNYIIFQLSWVQRRDGFTFLFMYVKKNILSFSRQKLFEILKKQTYVPHVNV